jgi:hypothetical protein
MVRYSVSGGVVTIEGSGTYEAAEWNAVYEAIRSDASVPDGARFVIDSRGTQVDFTSIRMIDRVRNLRVKLGTKLGRACALVMRPENLFSSRQFQYYAQQEIDLRVGMFTDMSEAKRWLGAA